MLFSVLTVITHKYGQKLIMKCDTCLHHLDVYIGHSIDSISRDAVQLHLRDCASCSDHLAELQLLRQLAALPVPTLSNNFVRNAFDKAAAVQRRKQNRLTVFSLSGALAASLAVFMLIPLLPGSHTDYAHTHTVSAATHHSLPLNKQGNLQIVFNSSLTEAATITLTLPEHVELKGYPGQHHITWQATLQKGKNQLILPLLAQHIARGELVAEIQTASDFERFKFILNTAGDAEPHGAKRSYHQAYNHRLS